MKQMPSASGCNGTLPTLHDGENGVPPSSLPGEGAWSELWDVIPDVVSGHSSRGLDFMDKFGQFLKERALIEEEYATKLRNLVKKSRGKKSDEESTDQKAYSYVCAFNVILAELESLAGQHEVVGDRFRHELVPALNEKCQRLRAGRKRCLQEFQSLKGQMDARCNDLSKEYRSYEKAFNEAQNAHTKFEKTRHNDHATKFEEQKAKANMHSKCQFYEQAKQSYAAEVGQANQAKHDYYELQLPRLLEEMRQLDVDRIDSTKVAMCEAIAAETGVLHIVQNCYNDMLTGVQKIDSERDTRVVVEQGKTGFGFPEDFYFTDLGDPTMDFHQQQSGTIRYDKDNLDGVNNGGGGSMKRGANSASALYNGNGDRPQAMNGGKGVVRKASMHQRFFGGVSSAIGGSGGISGKATSSGASGGNGTTGEYGTLPPQQRCRRIQQKLDELEQQMRTCLQSKAGLEKLHQSYTENPKFGDSKKAMAELVECRQKIDLLNVEMDRLKELLVHAQSELGAPLGGSMYHHHHHQGYTPGSAATSQASSPRSTHGKSTAGLAHGFVLRKRTSSVSGQSEDSSSTSQGGCDQPPGQQKVQSAAPSITTVSIGGGMTQEAAMAPTASCDYYECDDEPASSAFVEPSKSLATREGGGQFIALGTALALYAYDGASEEGAHDSSTVLMVEGDELLLLERDVGDGWTRVRHQKTSQEGFVPTTYIDCRWHSFTMAQNGGTVGGGWS